MRGVSIILILPLLLVACSNSSPPEELDNEYLNSPLDIRFHSSIMGMTRSNTYQPDLSNLASFKVAAFTHTSNPETFFPPMDVMQQADGTWLNSTTYYWPSQPLQFYAYAPSDLPFIVTSEAQLLTDYSVADSAAHQKDIITAWGHGKRSDFRETNDSIPLFFRHAMAIIEVRASNPSDNRVDILGVKICRIPSTGTLTMQQSENAFPSWTVKSNSEKDFFIKGSKNDSDSNSIVSLQNKNTAQNIMFGQEGWLLIPQKLIPWTCGPIADGAYISVLCQICDSNGRQLFPDEEGKYGFISIPINNTWEPGRHYVYILHFFKEGGAAGLIDPNPIAPNTSGDRDPDIDTMPGGVRQGGDAVISSPMSLTIEISDWIDTGINNIIAN